MKKSIQLLAAFLLLGLAGCGNMKESYNLSEQTAKDFHNQDADALCANFSDEMLEVMSCDVTKRVLEQTIAKVGEPTGECGWSLTYRITSFDPFQAVSVYKCPFEKEKVKLTITVDVTGEGAKVSGLWADSSILRKSGMLIDVKLCENLSGNKCGAEIEHARWDMEKIYVANNWQAIKEGDQITCKWYAPDGDEISKFTHRVKGDYNPYYSWCSIEPSYFTIENPYGAWEMTTELNGDKINTFEFEVVEK